MRRDALHWSGYVYFYVAALIGLSFVLFGLVSIYTGLLQAALPRSSPEFQYRAEDFAFDTAPLPEGDSPVPTLSPAEMARSEAETTEEIRAEGFFGALSGFGATIVGVPTFVWHLRRARRREAAGQSGGVPDQP